MTKLVAEILNFLATLTKKLWISNLLADLLNKVSIGAVAEPVNWIGASIRYGGFKHTLGKKRNAIYL